MNPIPASEAAAREFRIRLVGDFDVAGAPAITAALSQLADPQTAAGADLVIDMSGVTFMDSRGLTALCDGADALEAKGWRVILRRAPRHLALLFDAGIAAGWVAPQRARLMSEAPSSGSAESPNLTQVSGSQL